MQPIKYEKNFVNSVNKYSYDLLLNTATNPSWINNLSNGYFTSIIVIYLFIFTTVFILFKLEKASRKKSIQIEFDSKVVCHKFHFYSRNCYLKCAVNPDKVLTEQAESCQDYRAKK